MNDQAVAIYGSHNCLTNNLSEALVKAGSSVVFFDRKLTTTRFSKGDVKLDNMTLIVDDFENFKNYKFKYFIYLNVGENNHHDVNDFAQKELDRISKSIRPTSPKTIFVLPYYKNLKDNPNIESKVEEILKQENYLASFCFVPEVVCDDFLLCGNGPVNRFVKTFVKDNTIIKYSNVKNVNLVKSTALAKLLVKNLYSFGLYGKSVAYVTKNTSFSKTANGISKRLRQKHPKTLLVESFETSSVDKKIALETSYAQTLNLLEKIIKKVMKNNPVQTKEENFKIGKIDKFTKSEKKLTVVKRPKKKQIFKITSGKSIAKIVAKTLIVLLLVLLAPIISLGISLMGVKHTSNFGNTNADTTNLLLRVNEKIIEGNDKYMRVLSKISFGIDMFETPILVNSLLKDVNTTNIGKHEILSDTSRVVSSLERGDDLLPDNLEVLKSNLLAYATQQKQLLSELSDGKYSDQKRLFGLVDKDETTKTLSSILNINNIIVRLSTLLLSEEELSIAVVYQDNSILRPTGGKVSALALVDIRKMKIEKIEIFDADDPKLNIKGIVEAPSDLSLLTNNSQWEFQDYNWDPDVETSVKKMKWFLEKSMNKQLDGVVMIDKSFVDRLNNSLGDSGGNVQVLTNTKVDGDFQNIRSQELIGFIKNIFKFEEGEYSNLVRIVVEDLNYKHALVSFEDEQLNLSLKNLGWNGSIDRSDCDINCYSDYLYVVQSGLDKLATEAFTKNYNLKTKIEEGLIKRELTISYLPTLGHLANKISRLYLRVLVPQETGFSLVEVSSGNIKNQIRPNTAAVGEFKEAGLLVELSEGVKTDVLVSWESPLEITNEKFTYNFFWQKQPGTIGESMGVEIVFPENIELVSNMSASLTDGGVITYNTKLLSDFNELLEFRRIIK